MAGLKLSAEAVAACLDHAMPESERGGVRTNPDGWDKCLREILEACRLEDGWDGQGAKAPGVLTISWAIDIRYALEAAFLPAPSCVIPGLEGEVIFVWQAEGLTSWQVEAKGPGEADGFILRPGRPAEEFLGRPETHG